MHPRRVGFDERTGRFARLVVVGALVVAVARLRLATAALEMFRPASSFRRAIAPPQNASHMHVTNLKISSSRRLPNTFFFLAYAAIMREPR